MFTLFWHTYFTMSSIVLYRQNYHHATYQAQGTWQQFSQLVWSKDRSRPDNSVHCIADFTLMNMLHCVEKCYAWSHTCIPVGISLAQLPRSGELWMQKLKSQLVRTQSLNVLSLKPGVGQYMYISIHAALTARNFFLAYFYPSSPFTCIFSKTSPDFFLCWLWLTPVPV